MTTLIYTYKLHDFITYRLELHLNPGHLCPCEMRFIRRDFTDNQETLLMTVRQPLYGLSIQRRAVWNEPDWARREFLRVMTPSLRAYLKQLIDMKPKDKLLFTWEPPDGFRKGQRPL